MSSFRHCTLHFLCPQIPPHSLHKASTVPYIVLTFNIYFDYNCILILFCYYRSSFQRNSNPHHFIICYYYYVFSISLINSQLFVLFYQVWFGKSVERDRTNLMTVATLNREQVANDDHICGSS